MRLHDTFTQSLANHYIPFRIGAPFKRILGEHCEHTGAQVLFSRPKSMHTIEIGDAQIIGRNATLSQLQQKNMHSITLFFRVFN